MKTSKRFFSLLLALLMLLSLFPATALAEDPAGEIAPAEDPYFPDESEEGSIEPCSEDPEALPQPGDEPQEIVASGFSGYVRWTLSSDGVLEFSNPSGKNSS